MLNNNTAIKSKDMPTRQLGSTGIEISALSLGSWNSYGRIVNDQKMINEIISRGYESGIRFFDMADVYERGAAEESMGTALKTHNRESLILSSKVYMRMSDDPSDIGLSKERIMGGIDNSLRRIGTDYLDLYFCHRFDPNTPLEETIVAMNQLIQSGKIRHWGTSMWNADQIKSAFDIAAELNMVPPAVEQPELSLLSSEKYEFDSGPELRKRNMGVVTFSPLASGILSGKYDNGIPDNSRFAKKNKADMLHAALMNEASLQRTRAFKSLADKLECSRSQLAIAWAAAQPGVSSVITGATHLDQLNENLGAINITIDTETAEELKRIFSISLMEKARHKVGRLFKKAFN